MNRELRTVNCRYEQAVYGSFPFRDGGYAPLAHSPGCRKEWLEAFHKACREIGEKPRGSAGLAGMFFSMRIGARGPWMIVGVSSPGSDDRGRPDALAFHGLFVDKAEFRKVGFHPFLLAQALREDWGPQTSLGSGSTSIELSGESVNSQRRPHSQTIAAALVRGRKVSLASETPIAELASEVWDLLPVRARKRCSVATWAFANGPRFDLVGTPSLSAWELDRAYVDPSAEPSVTRRRPVRLVIIAAGILSLVALGVSTWWASRREGSRMISGFTAESPRPGTPGLHERFPTVRTVDPSPGPERESYAEGDENPDEVERAFERLLALRDMLPGLTPGDPFTGRPWVPRTFDDPDPMVNLLKQVYGRRYTGPLLSEAELAEIARSSSEGRSRALEWDRQIRHLLADRPQPADYRSGPLRWRLDTLAWSFHLEPESRLTSAEAIDAIAEALKLDEPIRANPLEAKYPALSEYAAYLKRLAIR